MAQGRQAESPAATGSPAVGEDITFQQREWTVQRLAWIVMTILVVAALLGLAGGGGPAMSATERTADGALQLHYARVERLQASTQLELDLATGSRDQLTVWIGSEFLSGTEIESIRPEPLETRSGADRQIFVFAVADGAGEIQVSFQYRHQDFGLLSGQAGILDGQELAFRQFVVP
jgi:hypothetical protein